MGGVDLLDSLLGYYRNKIRSTKWHHRIFFQLIDISIVNAWILWRKRNPSISLVRFKVADLFLMYQVSRKRKAGRPSNAHITPHVVSKIAIPHEAIRSDQVGHLPIFMEKRLFVANMTSAPFWHIYSVKSVILRFVWMITATVLKPFINNVFIYKDVFTEHN